MHGPASSRSRRTTSRTSLPATAPRSTRHSRRVWSVISPGGHRGRRGGAGQLGCPRRRDDRRGPHDPPSPTRSLPPGGPRTTVAASTPRTTPTVVNPAGKHPHRVPLRPHAGVVRRPRDRGRRPRPPHSGPRCVRPAPQLTQSPGRIDPGTPRGRRAASRWWGRVRVPRADGRRHRQPLRVEGRGPVRRRPFQPPTRSSETQRDAQARIENDWVRAALAAVDPRAAIVSAATSTISRSARRCRHLTSGGALTDSSPRCPATAGTLRLLRCLAGPRPHPGEPGTCAPRRATRWST